MDVTTLLVVAAIIAIAALFLLRPKKKGKSVLLVGLPNTGKTCFWMQMMTGEFPGTHTSMKENIGEIPSNLTPSKFKGKKIPLVDLPGHSRLRPLLDQKLTEARAIIFFIDSLDFTQTISSCAELLYTLLTDSKLVEQGTPMMMACNKRDLDFSYKLVTIKNKLESELNIVRKSKQNEIYSLGETDSVSKVVPLGVEGQPFSFDSQSPLPLYWCECSVKENNVSELTNWLWAIF